jgi:hypothetical protein
MESRQQTIYFIQQKRNSYARQKKKTRKSSSIQYNTKTHVWNVILKKAWTYYTDDTPL